MVRHLRGAAAVIIMAASANGLCGAPPEADDRAAVAEASFRWAVKERCIRFLCLLSIERKPIDSALLRRLKPLGKVEAAREDDFVFEDGAARGFSRRGGRIVNLRELTVTATELEASVKVDLISTGLGSTTCVYRLRRSEEGWEVDPKGVECIIT